MDEIFKTKYNCDAADVVTRQQCDYMAAEMGRMRRTDSGFLVGHVPVAKVGVMQYRLADGSLLRQYVPPETLFAADSIASLEMKPVTDEHPPERKVTLDNSFRVIGNTGEKVTKSENFLTASIIITDAAAIAHVQAGRRQLSPGYAVELVYRKGHTDSGEEYDAIQVGRRYNHLAVVDVARGGPDLKMQVDGSETGEFEMWSADELKLLQFVIDGMDKEVGDAVLSTEVRKNLPESSFCGPNRSFPVPDCAHVTAARRLIGRYQGPGSKEKILSCVNGKAARMGCSQNDHLNQERNMKFKIEGIEYDAAPEVVNFIARQDKVLSEAKTANDALKGERDGLKAQVDTLKARDVKKEINDGVRSRLALERQAQVILGKVDETMDDKAIRLAIIAKKLPNLKIAADAADAYIAAAFDSAVASMSKEETDSLAAQRQVVTEPQPQNNDASNMDADDRARAAYLRRLGNGGVDPKDTK